MASEGQPDHGGAHLVAAALSLSNILLGFDDAALNIATYLSANDNIALHSVNRGWHDFISRHEDSLFAKHLKRDFVEGVVLSYVAEKRNLSRKKLYFAFRKRWSLQKQGGEDDRVCIHWRRPIRPQRTENNTDGENDQNDDDVSALVFVARVGGEENPDYCTLMDWESERRNDKLVPSYEMYDEERDEGCLEIPQNEEATDILELDPPRYENWYTDLCKVWGIHTTSRFTS